jgi:hypothetical protein
MQSLICCLSSAAPPAGSVAAAGTIINKRLLAHIAVMARCIAILLRQLD